MDSEDEFDGILQNFMFGNIDENWLQNDILDEESRQHQGHHGCHTSFGLGSLIRVFRDSKEAEDSPIDSEFIAESEIMPIDYSYFKKTMTKADDIHLPETTSSLGAMVPRSQSMPRIDPSIAECSSKTSHKLSTPLAGLLAPELVDFDVRQWFPDFQPDKVLRFLRIFKSPYRPDRWSSNKKPKQCGLLSKGKGTKVLVATNDGRNPIECRPATSMLTKANSKQLDGNSSGSDTEVENVDVLIDDVILAGTEEEEDVENYGSLKLNMGRLPHSDELMVDDEDLLVQLMLDSGFNGGSSEANEWRHGPAKLWYDMYNCPESGIGFDYGFQLRRNSEQDDEHHLQLTPLQEIGFASDALLMVNLIHWEDDVIFDCSGDQIQDGADKLLGQKMPYCGWVPSTVFGTYEQFVKHHNPVLHEFLQKVSFFGPEPFVPSKLIDSVSVEETDDCNVTSMPVFYSIFPVENEELLYSKWEEDVIWDAKEMTKIPCPPVLTFDPDDDGLAPLEIPEDDTSPATEPLEEDNKRKRVGNSKVIVKRARTFKEETEREADMPIQSRDPFNLSNDEFYHQKRSPDQSFDHNLDQSVIPQSAPAYNTRKGAQFPKL